MKIYSRIALAILVVIAASFAAPAQRASARKFAPIGNIVATPLPGPVVFDRGGYPTTGISGTYFYNAVTADDFAFATPHRLTGATFYLFEITQPEGVFDSFSGTLTVTIFADDNGQPGNLLRSMTGTATTSGTGMFGFDLYAVYFDFPTPIDLPAGHYWLGYKENGIADPDDGTDVWWDSHGSSFGSIPQYSLAQGNNGSWSGAPGFEFCFMLHGDAAIEQPGPVGPGVDVTNSIMADDFVLNATRTLYGFTATIADGAGSPDNFQIDNFGGTLGWTVYNDIGGAPGFVVATGDATPTLVLTGRTDANGKDTANVEISFGAPIDLTAGTYWLALREGANLTLADSSQIRWANSSTTNGSEPYLITGIINGDAIAAQRPAPRTAGATQNAPDLAFSLWSAPLGPTAAGLSVSGRVLDAVGKAIPRATVTLVRASGRSLRTRSNALGYFSFDGIEAGETCVLGATAKRRRFDPQVVTVMDNVADVELIGR